MQNRKLTPLDFFLLQKYLFSALMKPTKAKIISYILLLLQVNQASSAMVCEESQRAHGVLGSMGLDNFSIKVFGFGIILIALACYNIFYQGRNGSRRVEIEQSVKECDPLDESPGE